MSAADFAKFLKAYPFNTNLTVFAARYNRLRNQNRLITGLDSRAFWQAVVAAANAGQLLPAQAHSLTYQWRGVINGAITQGHSVALVLTDAPPRVVKELIFFTIAMPNVQQVTVTQGLQALWSNSRSTFVPQ